MRKKKGQGRTGKKGGLKGSQYRIIPKKREAGEGQ